MSPRVIPPTLYLLAGAAIGVLAGFTIYGSFHSMGYGQGGFDLSPEFNYLVGSFKYGLGCAVVTAPVIRKLGEVMPPPIDDEIRTGNWKRHRPLSFVAFAFGGTFGALVGGFAAVPVPWFIAAIVLDSSSGASEAATPFGLLGAVGGAAWAARRALWLAEVWAVGPDRE